ncbi:hypothetical protein [Sphingomonas sp. R1]|uniref:hypothetical protein n=1 Tax=Sphingomonas sp. R1 TaxID=399176 RepID=UPI00222483DF|nr:hypothetical protein [Sphingomonas sp. R1]UYY77770.1 hypothetical protein OIM94_01825 [Sphingomonas sp. R1]
MCLVASQLTSIGYTFTKIALDKLPNSPPTSGHGYSCTVTPAQMFNEEITGPSGRLVSRGSPFLNEPSWPANYVRTFMRDNGLSTASSFFDCRRIARIVAGGSLATVRTTAIRKAMLLD